MKQHNLLYIVCICIVTTIYSCTSNQTKKSTKDLSALKVSGNVFTNDSNEIVRMMGVSFSDPDKLERDGQWSLKYFQEAKKWGCNVVRFPIHPYTWRYRGSEEYLKLVDQGVMWATQTGMYIILDWHAIGNMPAGKYAHINYATDWNETVKFWQTIATRYKGNTTVAFYELFNEPTEAGAPLSWKEWCPMMELLIDKINEVDNKKIYLIAGMNWAYELDSVIINPINRANVAYVTHPYPQKREQPWEAKWEEDFGKVSDIYPIVATEFGFVVAGERGEHIPVIGDETYGNTIIDYFDKKGISYTVWCFDPTWAPALLEDFNFTPTSRQGAFFKNILQRNLRKGDTLKK